MPKKAINPICQAVNVTVCDSPEHAKAEGYDYTAHPEGTYKPIQLNRIVVVNNGTVMGRATVDFVVEDENGQKYVFMVTSRILKALPLGGE